MSSTYITDKSKDVKITMSKINGSESKTDGTNQPPYMLLKHFTYLQFVVAHVDRVITNPFSIGYENIRDINAVMATPSVSDSIIEVAGNIPTGKYYPLFRGIVDVPVFGDSILTVSIGGVNYYLGPINTMNSPNLNLDTSYVDYATGSNPTKTTRSLYGLSEFYRVTGHLRLMKKFNNQLDGVGNDESIFNTSSDDVGDIHGDMLFEGRHGNSIRIGSRAKYPYIIISNGRSNATAVETVGDPCLLVMIDKGSLLDHFGGYVELSTGLQVPHFMLASDMIKEPRTTMLQLIADVNSTDDSVDPNDFYYKYNSPQTLLSSNRITINSIRGSIYMSSRAHIHLGAAETLTFTSNKETIFDSSNIYIGYGARGSDGKPAEDAEQMVLGTTLLEIIKELLDLLGDAAYLAYPAVPTPLGTTTLSAGPGTFKQGIVSIQQKIETILSDKHYIEPN